MDETRSPAADDAAAEAAILRHLLVLHPVQITFDELLRELSGGREDFAQRDAVERGVRDLTAAGLLHRHGEVVIPSRAALRFDQLLGG